VRSKLGCFFQPKLFPPWQRPLSILQAKPLWLVDPVITATGGDPLLQSDAIENYKDELFPLATLITPNLDESCAVLATKSRSQINGAHGERISRANSKPRFSSKAVTCPATTPSIFCFANGKITGIFRHPLFAMLRRMAPVALTPPQSPPISPKAQPSKIPSPARRSL